MTRCNTLARLLAATLLAAGASTALHAADQPATRATAATQAASPDDAALASKVQAALQEDKEVAVLPISVSAEQGVVVLVGTIPSAETARRALQLAAAVPGVKEVRSALKLPG
jgi:hyperosmotically inducible protein